jgi:hypothetical protein
MAELQCRGVFGGDVLEPGALQQLGQGFTVRNHDRLRDTEPLQFYGGSYYPFIAAFGKYDPCTDSGGPPPDVVYEAHPRWFEP